MRDAQTRACPHWRWRPAALALLALAALPSLWTGSAAATTVTWDGGCGLDTSWSCTANWLGGAVPGPEDTAAFNAISGNDSTVDAGFAGTVAGITIEPGYTGTITLARSLAVSTAFTQRAGAFTAAGQALTTKTLTLSGGTFTASSGTTSVGGALTISGTPTFNANGGTVNFNGTASVALSCNGVNFNHVTLTNTNGTKTVEGNCALPLSSPPKAGSGGSIVLNGTLSGTGTLTSSGTLTLGSGGSLSGFSGLAAKGLTVNGTHDFGSYSSFSVSNAFALNASASFTAPSGTAGFGGKFALSSSSTFNANGGTVNFKGMTSAALSCNGASFNLVTFTQTGGTKTVESNCALPLGSAPHAGSGGSIVLNGTLSGTGTLTSSGTLTLGSTGSLSGFSGLAARSLTVYGTRNFGSYAPFTVSGAFIAKAGAGFTAPSGTASFDGNFTLAPESTFSANGGTIELGGASNGVITCNGASFNLVTFTHTAGVKAVGKTCTLPLGSSPNANSGGWITLNGTLSGTGTLSTSGRTILGSGGSLSGFTGLVAETLTVNGSYNFGGYTTFSVSTRFTLNKGGSFTAPKNGTADFAATFTINPESTFSANGGTIDFNGATDGVLTCNGASFNLVEFTHTAGVKVVNSGCAMPLGAGPEAGKGGSIRVNGTLSGTGTLKTTGTLTLGSGGGLSSFSGLAAAGLSVEGSYSFGAYSPFTVSGNFTVGAGGNFTAPSGTASLGGDVTLSGGSFNANGGTVVLDGSDQRLAGSITFANLTKTPSAADTLSFAAGEKVTVTGTLTLKGAAAGEPLSLVSSSPGTSWSIDPQGSRDVRRVAVSDSKNENATAIAAYDSSGGSGNSGWEFPAPTVPGKPAAVETPTTDTTPTFAWTASEDGGLAPDHYEVQWSTDSSFATGVFEDSAVTTASCTLSTTTCGGETGLAIGTWYVRVRAFNALGAASAYSEVGSIEIIE